MTDNIHEKVAELSADLARASSSEIQESIFEALAQIGKHIDADRAYMFTFSEQQQKLDNALEWCRGNTAGVKDRHRNLNCDRYPWLMRQLWRGSSLPINDVAALPSAERAEQVDFRPQDTRSFLILPLRHDNQLFGLIGFDMVRTHFQWPEKLQRDLSLVAEIITGALRRESASLELAQMAPRIRKLMQPLPGMVFQYEVGPAGEARMPFVGENLERTFQIPSETLNRTAKPLLDRIHEDDYPRVIDGIRVSRERNSVFRDEFRMHVSNGGERWFEATAIPERSGDNVLWYGHLSEITSQMAAEQAIIDQGVWTETILNNIDDAVFSIDEKGIIQSLNHSAERIFGYQASALRGQKINMIMPEPYRSKHDTYIERYLCSGNAEIMGKSRELEGQRRDGSVFPVELQISQISMNGSQYFIGVIRDITQRRHSEQKIERLAYYDPLTELPNRRLLLNEMQRTRHVSPSESVMGAVLFLDLDNFKNLNDSLGHSTGDRFLVQVARRLETSIPEDGTVARIGGDEFVVLVPGLDAAPERAHLQAERVAQGIQRALSAPYTLADHDYTASFSIGVTLFYDHTQTQEDLLRQADIALHEAKQAGKNTVCFFTSQMQRDVEYKLKLETAIRKALEAEAFELHYQPQVLENGKITSVEALIRWYHPSEGWISPGRFIPLCEETGLILDLGDWVVEAACRQLAFWSHQQATANLIVAINISAKQFQQPDFAERIIQTIERTGAPANQLELELTESLLVQDTDDVIAKMDRLRERGVRFSLDDFGTGYSSLAYLKRLPFDQLKIDKSFVQDLLSNENDLEIARMIIALANAMKLEVVAEGVETWPQCRALTSIGCHRYQGFLFARPVPPENILTPITDVAASSPAGS